MSGSPPGAVVVGGSVNGLGAVRALAAHGVPVDLVVTHPGDVAQHSRCVREVCSLPEFPQHPASLVDLLERRRRRWAGWTILPTHDPALVALSQSLDRLERWYPGVVPPWEITRRLIDKPLTHAVAQEVGIDTPRSYGPATAETLRRPDLEFPVLVKPCQGHVFWERFGTKLFAAGDAGELTEAVARVGAVGIPAEVVDCVPGGDDRIYQYVVYVDRRGRPAAEFALHKLRQGPPHYGVARAAEAVAAPQLRERTLELLRRLEWRGIAAVEYKHDPRDGSFRLIEVNGRCFLANGLARRVGVNLPLLAWREHALGEAVAARPNGWPGVWLHLYADLLYTALSLGTERLDWRDFGRSYLRPKTFAVWSATDPKPFAVQWSRTLATAARLARDPRERAAVRARIQCPPLHRQTPLALRLSSSGRRGAPSS